MNEIPRRPGEIKKGQRRHFEDVCGKLGADFKRGKNEQRRMGISNTELARVTAKLKRKGKDNAGFGQVLARDKNMTREQAKITFKPFQGTGAFRSVTQRNG